MKQRIGIFSGTFDPVHKGHIAFALEAARVCRLDKVIFLPERLPRAKQNVTDIQHRLAMLRAATAEHPGLETALLRSSQFTVQQTLPEILQLCGDAKLTLLIGSDVAQTFARRWDGLGELFANVSLAIGMRHGSDPDKITSILQTLGATQPQAVRYTFISSPNATAASSHVRTGRQSAAITPATASYMQKLKLYK